MQSLIQSKCQSIVWAEGMLLQAQHFQYGQTLQQQQTIRFSQIFCQPNWGIVQLALDTAALASNIVKVSYCEVIFPNGWYIHYQEKPGSVLQIDLTELSESEALIYLCMPANYSVDGIPGYPKLSEGAAWRADWQKLADYYDPAREQEILTAIPNLYLTTKVENEKDLIAIPLCQIERQATQLWQFDNLYIAPVLHINESPALLTLINQWLHLIAEKTLKLRQYFITQAHSLTQWILSSALITLVRAQASLTQFLQNAWCSPAPVYLSMTETVYELAEYVLPEKIVLSPYQQKSTNQIFFQLDLMLRRSLEAIMLPKCQHWQFVGSDQNVAVIHGLETQHLQFGHAYLAVAHSNKDLTWINTFIKQTKIASANAIRVLMTTALSGVRLQHCVDLPMGFPYQPSYQYFALDNHSEEWQQIVVQKSLAIYRSNQFANDKIELIFLATPSVQDEN